MYKDKVLERCSFIQRRIISKHCRVFVVIQPETNHDFLSNSDQNNTFRFKNLFKTLFDPVFTAGLTIKRNYGHQYTLWITTVRPETLQNILEDIVVEWILFSKEILLATLWNNEEMNNFQLYYYNRYYGNPERIWIPLTCNLKEATNCFRRIDFTTTNISLLNKYFWDKSYYWNTPIFHSPGCQNGRKS